MKIVKDVLVTLLELPVSVSFPTMLIAIFNSLMVSVNELNMKKWKK